MPALWKAILMMLEIIADLIPASIHITVRQLRSRRYPDPGYFEAKIWEDKPDQTCFGFELQRHADRLRCDKCATCLGTTTNHATRLLAEQAAEKLASRRGYTVDIAPNRRVRAHHS